MAEFITYEQPESQLKVTEVLWGLLTQWKAILIVAVFFAVALPYAKFFKDTQSYQAAVNAAAAKTNEASKLASDVPLDTQVERILAGLPKDSRTAVEYISQQQQLAKEQYRYLNESILLNASPANQRTLSLSFFIRTNGEHDLQPLMDAYNLYLMHPSFIEKIGKIIAPNIGIKYINELVSVVSSPIADSDAKDTVLNVSIVLPNDVDASGVASLVKEEIKEDNSKLSGSIMEHTIEELRIEEIYNYNKTAIDRLQTINININSLQNNIKTQRSALSDSQKTALNDITQLLDEQEAANGGDDPRDNDVTADIEKPTFSKKFILVGFAGGVFAYAMVYLIICAINTNLSSADELKDFACSRSLGQIRWHGRHGLLGKLLHSKIVENLRWRYLGNVDAQVAKVASTTESACKNVGSKNLAVLTMTSSSTSKKIVSGLTSSLNQLGIAVSTVNASDKRDEHMFLSFKEAVLVVEIGTKRSDVWKVAELCRTYGIRLLGNIFVGNM